MPTTNTVEKEIKNYIKEEQKIVLKDIGDHLEELYCPECIDDFIERHTDCCFGCAINDVIAEFDKDNVKLLNFHKEGEIIEISPFLLEALEEINPKNPFLALCKILPKKIDLELIFSKMLCPKCGETYLNYYYETKLNKEEAPTVIKHTHNPVRVFIYMCKDCNFKTILSDYDLGEKPVKNEEE